MIWYVAKSFEAFLQNVNNSANERWLIMHVTIYSAYLIQYVNALIIGESFIRLISFFHSDSLPLQS